MNITLLPLEPDALCHRFFIRADGQHAGGITIHSVQGDRFSYGIAITPSLRRKGIAGHALSLLFERMKSLGFSQVIVQIAPENAASLALHRALGFAESGRDVGAVIMKKSL